MRRGRRGKAPGRFPGQRRAKRTPTPQAPTDAASQAATTDAPLLRCLPRAKPGTPTAARAGRSAGGQAQAKKRDWTMRRQRVNLRPFLPVHLRSPPSPLELPPPPCIPALGLTRLRRSDGSPLRGRLCARWELGIATMEDEGGGGASAAASRTLSRRSAEVSKMGRLRDTCPRRRGRLVSRKLFACPATKPPKSSR